MNQFNGITLLVSIIYSSQIAEEFRRFFQKTQMVENSLFSKFFFNSRRVEDSLKWKNDFIYIFHCNISIN